MDKALQEALLARLADADDRTMTIIIVRAIPSRPPLPKIDLAALFQTKSQEMPIQKPAPVLRVLKRLHAQAREERETAQRKQRAEWRREHKAGQSAHKHSGWFNKKSFHRAVGGAS